MEAMLLTKPVGGSAVVKPVRSHFGACSNDAEGGANAHRSAHVFGSRLTPHCPLHAPPARYRSWRCPRRSRRRDWRNSSSVRSRPSNSILLEAFWRKTEDGNSSRRAYPGRARPYRACVTSILPNAIARARAVRVGNARRGRVYWFPPWNIAVCSNTSC